MAFVEIPTFIIVTRFDRLENILLRPCGPGMPILFKGTPEMKHLVTHPEGIQALLLKHEIDKGSEQVFIMGWIGVTENQVTEIPWASFKDERMQVLDKLIQDSAHAAHDTIVRKYGWNLQSVPEQPK